MTWLKRMPRPLPSRANSTAWPPLCVMKTHRAAFPLKVATRQKGEAAAGE